MDQPTRGKIRILAKGCSATMSFLRNPNDRYNNVAPLFNQKRLGPEPDLLLEDIASARRSTANLVRNGAFEGNLACKREQRR
jgi:hypothetical protein